MKKNILRIASLTLAMMVLASLVVPAFAAGPAGQGALPETGMTVSGILQNGEETDGYPKTEPADEPSEEVSEASDAAEDAPAEVHETSAVVEGVPEEMPEVPDTAEDAPEDVSEVSDTAENAALELNAEPMPLAETGADGFIRGTEDDSDYWWKLDENGTLTIKGTKMAGWQDWDSYEPWHADRESISKIVIQEGITNIGYGAFHGCINLTEVTLPKGLTSIDRWAFASCSSLTKLTLPEGVTSIGDSAFLGCRSLTSVTLPDSVTTLGYDAFRDCSGLTSVVIPDSVVNTRYAGDKTGIFLGCTSLTSAGPIGGDYAIQYGHTNTIPEALFMGSSIKSVTIPDGVTSIRNSAFRECSSLTSIIIPESVEYMDYGIFKDCTSLTSAGPIGGNYNIQFGWTNKIPARAFDSSSLEQAVIPDGITMIGYDAFRDCSRLSSVIIPQSAYFQVDTSGNDEGMFSGCSSLISAGPIGENCNIQFGWNTQIPWNAFYGSDVVSVTIPDGVTEIGSEAFAGCTSLTSIKIPDSMVEIGSEAFAGCTSLTNVVIPDKVTKLGMDVFEGCSGLATVIIPGNVKIPWGSQWMNGLFSKCTSLTNAGPIGGNYNIQYGSTGEIPSKFFYGADITEITIPKEIVRIQSEAFYNCRHLTDVYYSGSESDWKAITIENKNEALVNATIHYNSTGSDSEKPGVTPVKLTTPSTPTATDTSIRTIGGTYYDTIAGSEVTWSADFGWDYFVDSEHYKSTEYNSELAKVSLALSAAIEGSKDGKERVKKILDGTGSNGLGCTYSDINGYKELSPAIAIAHKFIIHPDNTRTRIFIIVLRGTTSDSDIRNDISSALFWNDWGASDIEKYIYDYMSLYDDTPENTKFLVTGHSLGAACANLVAKDLSDAFGIENVFAYTFAAPSPCRNIALGEYNNVFNFLCYQDNVPLCLSTRSNWAGYGKCAWFGYILNPQLEDCYNNGLTKKTWQTTYYEQPLFRLHAPSAYYAYLLCKDSPFSGSDIINNIINGVRFKCPVDIWVYDSSGNPVGHIQDDKVDFDNYAESVMLAVEDTAKYVYFTGDGTYTLKITGTDTGTMTYTAFSVDMNTNTVVESKIFSNAQIENNKSFTSIVSSNDETETDKVEIPDVQLFVVNSEGIPEREVLPDGEGTEVPIESEAPKPVDPTPENPTPENPTPENPTPENPTSENPTPENPAPETPAAAATASPILKTTSADVHMGIILMLAAAGVLTLVCAVIVKKVMIHNA